jgi:hypothetical protein
LAHGRTHGDALLGAFGPRDDKAARTVAGFKLINVTGADIGGPHQSVTLSGAMADIDVIRCQNLTGMTGECG